MSSGKWRPSCLGLNVLIHPNGVICLHTPWLNTKPVPDSMMTWYSRTYQNKIYIFMKCNCLKVLKWSNRNELIVLKQNGFTSFPHLLNKHLSFQPIIHMVHKAHSTLRWRQIEMQSFWLPSFVKWPQRYQLMPDNDLVSFPGDHSISQVHWQKYQSQ